MRILFDTDGLTNKCPRYVNVDVNQCRSCHRYSGEYAFEVWCAVPFDELPPHVQERLLTYWEESKFEE